MVQKELNTRELIVEFYSAKNLGIKAEGGEWFNFDSEASSVQKEEMRSLIGGLTKGSRVELVLVDEAHFSDFKVLAKGAISKPKTNNFMDDYVGFDELLKEARSKYPEMSITTDLVEHDFKEKRAVVKATVILNDSASVHQFFDAYGDANQDNVSNGNIARHYLRMAETRGIARCLRWVLGRSTVKEELK